MKSDDYLIKEHPHKEYFDDVFEEIKKIGVNAALSAVADNTAANKRLAEFMVNTRELVENEAILIIDAMSAAFDKKCEALNSLRQATKEVEAFVNYTNRSIANVNINVVTLKGLNSEISSLNENLEKFKSLVDDGTFEKAAKLVKP